METESSPGYSPEQDPAPARNEDQSREGVLGSDLMAMEDDFLGLDQNKLDLRNVLDEVHEKASQVIKFTLKWEEVVAQYTTMEMLLKERTMDEIVSKDDHEQIICVDSEFHDFKKTMSSFMVGQIWALYDPRDEMPRYYARIKRIIKSRLSFEVTWLEPIDEEFVPVACGRFKYGITETLKSHLTFSHQMHPIIHGKNMDVIPKEGETWALFRDWNKGWNNNPKHHQPPYNYDLVEVVLRFDDHQGIGVAYLGKVDGFVSVFRHSAQRGVCSCVIPPEEVRRFSHRVPSIRLNGEEKEGVTAGSFELDPAAVPTCVREEAKAIERQSQDCGKASALIITLD